MPTSPAGFRDMLRGDALSLALGALLVVGGLLTLVFWAGARRRAAALLWLGIFAFLYGLRLLARTGTFRLTFDVAPAVWEYIAAAITYVAPLPVVLFVRAVVPIWRRFTLLSIWGLTIFAACAIASDAVLHRPNSANTANNLIAMTFIGALLALVFRPGLTRSRELSMLRVGILAAAGTAVADNLRGMLVLAFPGQAVEPFGVTVLVVCLGVLAVRRVVGDARRLAAIDQELQIARQIQSSILPQGVPGTLGVRLAARYRPMNAVAGDFYDFIELDPHRLGVLVADVSGHGIPAALIASMVKVALAAQEGQGDRPAALLEGMNKVLFGRLGGQYLTAAYIFIDEHSRLFRYAAAGHPPMLRLTRRGLDVREFEKNGLALGFVGDAKYEELEQPLEGGERLLLYTDGLTEAANAADDFFGLGRLKSAIVAGAALPPDAASDVLLASVEAWSGQPAGDDLTIVLVDISP
jgi:sigma-B regulation protein RsbU (phosphoserine phosphatase)